MAKWEDRTKTTRTADAASLSGSGRPMIVVLAGPSIGSMHPLRGALVFGRGKEADVRIDDEGLSRRHAKIELEAEGVFVHDLNSKNGVFVGGHRTLRRKLKDGDQIRIGSTTALKFVMQDHLEERFHRQMFEAALKDGVTKIFNRKYFVDRLRSEFAFAVRHELPLSLVLFDLDDFKQVNDTYGHLAGDYTLAAMAHAVSEWIRAEDVFARYGGEEFGLIGREVAADAALVLGERVRKSVERFPFSFDGKRFPVTVSVGVVSLPDPAIKDAAAFLAAADAALYAAKHGGRNRVVAHQPQR